MKIKRGIDALVNERETLVRRLRASNQDAADLLNGLKLDWFKIRNAADEDTAEVLIYEAIGGWFGVPADEFVRELNGITAQNIHVRINSPGGSVFDSIAIYNALVKHPAKVTVYVDSLAASGASVIAMAGDDIVMMVGSQMMIHDASGIEMGDARMMREMADFLDKQSDNIASIYAAKIGGDPAEMRALMLAETWMMAQEAVDLGLADRVYSKEMDKPTDPEEDDDESSEDGAEEETATEEVESEEDIENLMRRPHALAAMNYKYAGRRKAPAPPTNSIVDDADVDRFIAGMRKVLGSK